MYMKDDLIIIAGPCSAESEEQVMNTAEQLYSKGIRIFRAGAWKPRTRCGQFEGYGEDALIWMQKVKKKYPHIKLATEVAKPEHIGLCLKYGIDIIWIGARTTASPFAVQDLANVFVDRPDLCDKFEVYVKNPVNPDIDLWIGAIERFQVAGVKDVKAIHRGFCLYDNKVYRNVPTWQIPIELKKRKPNMTIICDPSHISGRRDLIAPLCQQAINLGFDGLMIESHCDPDHALTDSKQQILPDVLEYILSNLSEQNDKAGMTNSMLAVHREKIDLIDDEIIRCLVERLKECRSIGYIKKTCNMPIFQNDRYEEVMNKFINKASSYGMNPDLAQQIFAAIHEESVREQTEIKL